MIRKKLREKRKNLSKAQHYTSSFKIVTKLLKFNLLKYQKIAIYSDGDGEIKTTQIIKILKKHGIEVYLPIIVKDKLKFGKISKFFKVNKFGIKEPKGSQILNANQLNLIILPLVGFDDFNHRIGMGGGFYDKTLAFRQSQKKYQYPKLYGIGFKFQKIKINPQPWDIKMDKIVAV